MYETEEIDTEVCMCAICARKKFIQEAAMTLLTVIMVEIVK